MVLTVKDNLKKPFGRLKDLFNNLSFQAKLILSIVFGISIFITLCAFLIIQNIQSNIDNQVLKLNYNLRTAQTLSQVGGQALILNFKTREAREKRLNGIINELTKKEPHKLSFVIFTDNSGRILAKSQFANLYKLSNTSSDKIQPPKHVPYIKTTYSDSGKVLTIAEPIQYGSNFLGWVWVGFPDEGFTIVGSNKELLIFLLEIFMLVWLLSVIGAIVNSLIITRPLRKLEKSAKAISEGRFGFQLPLRGFLGKELSQLVKAFNKMSKRLEQYEESNIASLSSERNKFESVVMSITDGVIVLDKEGTIQIINFAANKMLNMSSDELMGQKATKIWNPKINAQIVGYLKNMSNSKVNIEQIDFDYIKEGRNLKVFITPIESQNEEKLGALIVIHDRTKEAEIELMKQEFISNVSHELRTPITSIKCYVDTLCSHEHQIDDKTRKEFLTIVNEETDRLSKLVNDVLELSRLESPAMKLQLTLQEVYPSIEYAAKATIVLAEKKSIKLKLETDHDLPLLNINQENLERIFVNLISNAIKYTPGNGVVKLVAKKVNNEVLFQIIDNGIGIPEEHLKLIFERFYRVENKVHTVKGTGLGLTIVKKSIEQHNGILSVRSKYGEGSIFEFSLPIPNSENRVKDFDKEVAKTA
jgi:two-component system sensor histidine kinase NblS